MGCTGFGITVGGSGVGAGGSGVRAGVGVDADGGDFHGHLEVVSIRFIGREFLFWLSSRIRLPHFLLFLGFLRLFLLGCGSSFFFFPAVSTFSFRSAVICSTVALVSTYFSDGSAAFRMSAWGVGSSANSVV